MVVEHEITLEIGLAKGARVGMHINTRVEKCGSLPLKGSHSGLRALDSLLCQAALVVALFSLLFTLSVPLKRLPFRQDAFFLRPCIKRGRDVDQA